MRYIVWIKQRRDGSWEENGEGSLTKLQADRIAKETRHLVVAVRVLPVGEEPTSFGEPAKEGSIVRGTIGTPRPA